MKEWKVKSKTESCIILYHGLTKPYNWHSLVMVYKLLHQVFQIFLLICFETLPYYGSPGWLRTHHIDLALNTKLSSLSLASAGLKGFRHHINFSFSLIFIVSLTFNKRAISPAQASIFNPIFILLLSLSIHA